MKPEEGLNLLKGYFPDLSEEKIFKFSRLYPLYRDWNEKINLISRKDIEELYLRHVLHSLSIARFINFSPGSRILDIGTGGGFPGIPLAIYFPECEFILADSIAKKINVVNDIISELQLNNANTFCGRVEKIGGQFDFIVSRAVADVSLLIQWTHHQINNQSRNALPNGWICLKGGDLVEETAKLRHPFSITPLSKWFHEDFFETKRILFVEAKKNRVS